MTVLETRTDGQGQANGQQQATTGADSVPAAAPAHGALAGADAKVAHTVADIVARAKDSGGEKIEFVYFKRAEYAIYRRGAPPQVVVAYSDVTATADQQVAAISPLLPLRDHLVRLMEDLPPKAQEHYRADRQQDGLAGRTRHRFRRRLP
jgi:hypothetical protein